MKTLHSKAWVAIVAMALAMVPAAFSQSTSTAPAGHKGRLGFHLGLMMDYLDLSDAQRGQVKQVIASEKPTLIPLVQQLVETRQQILQEVSSGIFDQAKISALASQQSQTQTQLNVEKAKVMAQIFNLLTPDQKTKAVSFLQKRAARVEQHLRKAQQKSSTQQ
jgi:protein CpxP